jgi:hypothetical protein
MRCNPHRLLRLQAICANQFQRIPYVLNGMAGNFRAVERLYRAVDNLWRHVLSRRSRAGYV